MSHKKELSREEWKGQLIGQATDSSFLPERPPKRPYRVIRLMDETHKRLIYGKDNPL